MTFARLDSSDPTIAVGWSLFAAASQRTIRCTHPDPLDGLREVERQARGERGRWVGFLSYDLGRVLDDVRLVPAAGGLPSYAFTWVPADSGETHVAPPRHVQRSNALRANFRRDEYLQAVRRCIDYIAAGDVFQVNLSQRFTIGLPAQPSAIYDRLLARSPARYGTYLDFGDFALLSNSPELFLRVEPMPDGRRKVITRPIKGTRPRLTGMDRELRASIKDQAELNMIVDLERNDLGRVCEIGSVRVTRPREIEAHPTVYHGSATIEGILRRDVTLVDLLRATFPGGSVTGAPKIRAMQVIDELEPDQRGPYCGAIGYIASDGSMEFNIAIRTMIVRDGLVHVPVGGGIVADSDPAAEHEETLVKARAMFAALGVSADEVARCVGARGRGR
jgi:para-aminobenzoate synthetase component 1